MDKFKIRILCRKTWNRSYKKPLSWLIYKKSTVEDFIIEIDDNYQSFNITILTL